MGKFAVILPAAGRSTRFGNAKQKKVFAELDGRAVWLRAAEPFVNRDDVGQTIVVIAPEDRELFELRFRASVAFLNIRVIEGGAERSDSIAKALEILEPDCEFVAIHDAARPCVTADQIDAVFAAAREHGAALLAVPVADTIKRVGADRHTTETVPRRDLYLAQTPQVFRRELLLQAYANRAQLGADVTDDTQLVEALGQSCAVVESTSLNLKITSQADLRLASAVLQALPKPKRDGPVHPFTDERAMW
ncbi:2-C-methyl-D-erythritol 4-phosphate cytidylyltransferase [Singulisphaera sp. GP187]|uniref:2-C-methyl-D-erythritol 4-phosphate cytidylyltransferase n=1 Tax=Singulisphaera sp. GP187 TaxID=1882752 RepID=UPI0009289DD2|nr:2-C-methyl-D-erythritol 4-phosphate cytidylyltransferase [Singulisphaera sp. GP187]SIN76248.1 2-C-methyl-D-erythritol 4-phosphate cytidylyltransferase [Singulisphaera sp. GP187]